VPLLAVLEQVAEHDHPRPPIWSFPTRWLRWVAGLPSFRLGYVFGFAFFLVGTHWIARLSDVAITVPWLKYPAWIAAAAYLAIYPALASSLSVSLARRSGLSLAATFPVGYLLIEELRASGELGFPWFQPGYAVHAYPPVIQLASLGSVTLVTLWVLIVNVLLWRALMPSRTRASSRALAAGGLLLAVALPVSYGAKVLSAADATAARDTTARAPVALIQANIDGKIKWAGTHRREILDRFLTLSRKAAEGGPRPGLIVWPETATGTYLRREVDQAIEVARLANELRVPIFTGYADYSVDSLGAVGYYNAAGTFPADGSLGERYAKRHLVPFGERMPFQWLLPMLGKIELGQAEWRPGTRAVVFQGPSGPFTCLICFEAIFPDLARDDVRHGARLLVNITNDEWFGESVALGQHAGMAVLRAVENHVPMARCANTGLTLLVDAWGRVRGRVPPYTAAVLTGDPGPAGLPTPFTRLGDWPGTLALFVGIALAARRWRT
jgi:apolipoprotein N-acyltransferase